MFDRNQIFRGDVDAAGGLLSKSIKNEIPPDANYLVLLRQFVTTLADQTGFSEVDTQDIELALDEACSNSMAGSIVEEFSEEKSTIKLEIIVDADHLVIDICDHGGDFSQYFEQDVNIQIQRRHRS